MFCSSKKGEFATVAHTGDSRATAFAMGSIIGGMVDLAGYLGCYVLPAFMSGKGQLDNNHPPPPSSANYTAA